MSGGGSTQTQTSTTEPNKAVQPILDAGMSDALKQYRNGGLIKPSQTVVPYAQQTTQGMNAQQALGQGNINGQGISGQYQGIIDNGGYNQNQMDALSGIRDTATSSFDPYGNPAFRQVLDQALEGSMTGVNTNAAAMGRYGSGTHQGVMQREQGNLAARMIGDEYRNWQGRQDNAQQQLFNAGQQGFNNLGNAYEGMQAPIDSLMGVGAMNEDLYGRVLNDKITNDNLGYANLQALLGLANYGSGYGTTTQKAQMPGSTASNIAGGLLGGASLLSGLL